MLRLKKVIVILIITVVITLPVAVMDQGGQKLCSQMEQVGKMTPVYKKMGIKIQV